QKMAERGGPSEGESERGQQRNTHGDGKRPEERAGYAGDTDERKKNDNWRNCRTNQRNANFPQSAADRFGTALSRIAMQHDIFDYHDGIINHETHRGSEAAEGHQIE